jgi:hypothetical protein
LTKPRTRARKRDGRCYELCFRSLFDMPEPGDWVLVHGIVGSTDTGHAWFTDGKDVFDPVRGEVLGSEFIPVPAYQNLSDARGTVTYTKAEACEKALATKHFGPWHEEE